MVTDPQVVSALEPPPKMSSFALPYWQATREQRLLLQFCRKTGKPQFPPRPNSRFTGHRDVEWRESKGLGVLRALSVVRKAIGRAVPYIIVTVELDEAVMIVGRLNADLTGVPKLGARVKPQWALLADGYYRLEFALV